MADPQSPSQSNVIDVSTQLANRGWQEPIALSSGDNPDDAVRAYDLSHASGMPAGSVYEHLDDVDKAYKTKTTNDIVQDDPYLQGYIRSHPLAAKISNDDWGNLGKLSEILQRTRQGPLGAPSSIGQATVTSFSDAAQDALKNYQTISPEQRAAYPQAAAALDEIARNPVFRALKNTPILAPMTAPWTIDKGLGALFSGALGAIHGGALETAKQVGLPESAAESIAAEGTAMAEAELGGLTGRGHAGEIPLETAHEVAANRQISEAVKLAKPYFDEAQRTGKPVELPQGLHPLIDQYHAVQSLLDEQNEDEAFKTIQSSTTKDRSPEFIARHFLDRFQHPNIEVSGEKVLELYGGKEPSPDDNLLGWVPDIKDQLRRAVAEGGDITIPKADWLANLEPDLRKELKDFTRFRPGGMTPLEAEEALKPQLGPHDEEYRPYKDVPDQLMGFRKEGPQKGFDAENYKWEQPVRVNIEGQPPFDDTIKGLNKHHALERARRNWPDAEIEALDQHPEVSGLNDVAHLAQRVEPTLPGAGRANIIPENAIQGAGNFRGQEIPTTSFNVGDIVNKLELDHLPDATRELSRFFKDRIADQAGDVPIHVADQQAIDSILQKDYPGKSGIPGFYDPGKHQIFLTTDLVNGNLPDWVRTHIILHEAAHAMSVHQLTAYPELKAATRQLMNVTDKYFNEVNPSARVFHNYAFTNEQEFIAEAMSDAPFQAELQRIAIPKDLARGFGIPESTGTIWDMARKIVKELITKVFGSVPSHTVMDAIFKVNEIFEQAKAMERGEAVPHFAPKQGELDVTRTEDKQSFENAKALGMKVKTFQRMQDLAKKRAQEDLDYAAKKQAKSEAERQTKEWKEQETEVRTQAKDAIEHRPDVAADIFLRTGRLFGEKYGRVRLDAAELTKEQKAALDPEHYGEGGIKPDDLAGLVGLQSGEQLVEDLVGLRQTREAEGLTPQAHISKMVDVEAEREMKSRYGSLDQRLAEDAKEHVLSATNFDILHEDTVRYATEAKQQISFTKEQLRDWAKTEFEGSKVGNIKSTKQLEHVGRLGRKIEDHAAAGEWADAFKLAQQRQVAFEFGRLALKFEKRMAQFDRRAKMFSKREVSSVPIDYSNAAQDILQRVGETVRRTAGEVAKEYKDTGSAGLREWVQSKDIPAVFTPDDNFPADTSRTLTVADFLKDPEYKKEVKEMSVEEFGRVHDAIESIYQNGRREKNFFKGQDAIELNQLISNLVGQMKDVLGGKVIQYPEGMVRASFPKVALASLLQMESVFKRLDQGNPNGLFKKTVIDQLMAGANYKDTLERQYAKQWKGLTFPEDLNKKVANHLFFDPLQKGGEIPDYPATLTRRNLLAILQNVGNWSNFDKLTGGRNIPSKAVADWKERGYQLADNDPTMQWLFKHTTKEDWDRAQAIGKMFEDLFEKSENMYYGLGARPGPRIPLKQIETPYGTYDGWYHPVIYDPARPMFPKEGETGEVEMIGGSRKLIGKDPMEDNGFYQPSTPSGYTKQRTGYKAPLLLSFDSVPHRMKQMISDIALREPVGEAYKVFSNPKFRTAMSSYMGHEYTQMLTDYLKDIAGQSRQVDAMQSTMGYWAQWVMQNTVSTLIGLNPGTVLKHGPTALASSVGEIGIKRFGSEFLHMWMSPDGWKDFHWMMHGGDVNGENWIGSEEMQRRGRNWQETLSGANYDMFTKGTSKEVWYENWRQAMIKFSSTPVAWSDLGSAAPLWMAKYKDMIENGETHGDAVGEADRAVRSAHGSTSVAARPAFTRNPWGRVIAPFFTFFNDLFNRNYDTIWRLKDGGGFNQKGEYLSGKQNITPVARNLFYYMVVPALVEQAISPIVFGKQDSYAKMGAEMLLRQGASMIPIVRDLVEAMLHNSDPSIGVAPVAIKSMTEIANDIKNGQVSLAPEHRARTVKHAATALGVATGLSNSQLGRWGGFAYDYATGRQRPKGGGDWYRAMRFGNIKEPKR